MIPIRLNIVGYFTIDIDVHVVPIVGRTLDYHGCTPTGGIIHFRCRVDNVQYMMGHKNTVAAIVIASGLEVSSDNE